MIVSNQNKYFHVYYFSLFYFPLTFSNLGLEWKLSMARMNEVSRAHTQLKVIFLIETISNNENKSTSTIIIKNMSYRIGLKVKSSSTQILDTLEEITKIPSSSFGKNLNNNNHHDDNNNNDDGDDNCSITIKDKQNQLSSILTSVRNTNVNKSSDESSSPMLVPLSAISNAKQILQQTLTMAKQTNETTLLMNITKLQNQLETDLKQTTQLSFTNSNNKSATESTSSDADAKEKYKKRIERLKLKVEERNYTKLTSNLDVTKADDATLSSMLYASSVGANMIVAPISIGVLMYFFAGKLMVWILGPDAAESYDESKSSKDGKLNIAGVIAGVVSGVIMLFIEMILFVIRNHEMDAAVTKKKKLSQKNPFGYEPKTAERTFHG